MMFSALKAQFYMQFLLTMYDILNHNFNIIFHEGYGWAKTKNVYIHK